MWEYQGCLMAANAGYKNRGIRMYTLNGNFPVGNTCQSPLWIPSESSLLGAEVHTPIRVTMVHSRGLSESTKDRFIYLLLSVSEWACRRSSFFWKKKRNELFFLCWDRQTKHHPICTEESRGHGRYWLGSRPERPAWVDHTLVKV